MGQDLWKFFMKGWAWLTFGKHRVGRWKVLNLLQANQAIGYHVVVRHPRLYKWTATFRECKGIERKVATSRGGGWRDVRQWRVKGVVRQTWGCERKRRRGRYGAVHQSRPRKLMTKGHKSRRRLLAMVGTQTRTMTYKMTIPFHGCFRFCCVCKMSCGS